MPDETRHPSFLGKETYTFDDKGRITVPKRWRQEGEEESFLLVPDSLGRCLRMMHRWRFDLIAEEVKQQLGADLPRYRLFMRNFHSNSIEVTTDKQGRVAIPKEQRDQMKLDGAVTMVGAGDLIEIWNTEAFEAHRRHEQAEYQLHLGRVGM